MNTVAPHLAALIDIGGNPIVQLVIVLFLCGAIYMIWQKVLMPFVGKMVADPWLGVIDWIIFIALILWAFATALWVIFGIDLFGPLRSM
jgi:hypothetical protein